MEPLALKKQIHAAAVKAQVRALTALQQAAEDRMVAIRERSDDDETNRFESTREENFESVELIAPQLEAARDQLAALERLAPDTTVEAVGPGAVVQTDTQHFLVGVSLTAFAAAGHDYIGISTEAPVYQALVGKRAGDTATWGEQTYRIRAVF